MLEDKRFRPEDLVILSNENVPEKDMRYGGYLDAALRMVWGKKAESMSSTFGETTIKEIMEFLLKIRGSSGTVSEFCDTLKSIYPALDLKVYDVKPFVPEYSITNELIKKGTVEVEVNGVKKTLTRAEFIDLIVATAGEEEKYTGVKTRMKIVDETSLDDKAVQKGKEEFMAELYEAMKASPAIPNTEIEARIEKITQPPLRFFESKAAEYEYWTKEAISTAKEGRLHLLTAHDLTEVKALEKKLHDKLGNNREVHVLTYTSEMDNIDEITRVLRQASEYAKKGEGVILVSDRAYRGVDIEVNDKGETFVKIEIKGSGGKTETRLLPIKEGGGRVSYVGGPSSIADLVQALGRVARSRFAGVKEWGLTFDNPVLAKYLDMVIMGKAGFDEKAVEGLLATLDKAGKTKEKETLETFIDGYKNGSMPIDVLNALTMAQGVSAKKPFKIGKTEINSTEDLKAYFAKKYNKETHSFEISASEQKELYGLILECYEQVKMDMTRNIIQVSKDGDIKSKAKKPLLELYNRVDDPLSLSRLACTQMTDKLFEMGDINGKRPVTEADVKYLTARIVEITGLDEKNIDISNLVTMKMNVEDAKIAISKALFAGMDPGFMQDRSKRFSLQLLLFDATSWAYGNESKMAMDSANAETRESSIREVWGTAQKKLLEVLFRKYFYSDTTKNVLTKAARAKTKSGGYKIVEVTGSIVDSTKTMPGKAGITEVEIKGNAWFDISERSCLELAGMGIKGIYLADGMELTRYNIESVKALVNSEAAGDKALIMTSDGLFVARKDKEKGWVISGTDVSSSNMEGLVTQIAESQGKIKPTLFYQFVKARIKAAGSPEGVFGITGDKANANLDDAYKNLRTIVAGDKALEDKLDDAMKMTGEEFKLKHNPDAAQKPGKVLSKAGRFMYVPNDPKVRADTSDIFGSWKELILRMNGFASISELDDALKRQEPIELPENLATDMIKNSGIAGFAEVVAKQVVPTGSGAIGMAFGINLITAYGREALAAMRGQADPYFLSHPGEVLTGAIDNARWAPIYAIGDRTLELGVTALVRAPQVGPVSNIMSAKAWGAFDYKGFAKYNFSYAPFLFASGMGYAWFDAESRYEALLTSNNPAERLMGENLMWQYRRGEGKINFLYETGSITGNLFGLGFLSRLGISMGAVQIGRMVGIDHEKDEKAAMAKYGPDIEAWNKGYESGQIKISPEDQRLVKDRKDETEAGKRGFGLFDTEYRIAFDQLMSAGAVNAAKWGMGKTGMMIADAATGKLVANEALKEAGMAGAARFGASKAVSAANAYLWVPFIIGYGSAGVTWITDETAGISSHERDIRASVFDRYTAEGGFREGLLWFFGFKNVFEKYTIGDNFSTLADAAIKEQIENEANWDYYMAQFRSTMMMTGGKNIITREMITGGNVPVPNAAPGSSMTSWTDSQMVYNEGGIAKGRPWEANKEEVWHLINETFNQVNPKRPETVEKAVQRYLKLLKLLGGDAGMKKGFEELMYITEKIYAQSGDKIVESFKQSTLAVLGETASKGVTEYKAYLAKNESRIKAAGLTLDDCLQGNNFAKYYAEYAYEKRVATINDLMASGKAPKERCEAELASLKKNKDKMTTELRTEITRSGSKSVKDFLVFAMLAGDDGFKAYAKKDVADYSPAELMKLYEEYLASDQVKDQLIGSAVAIHKKIHDEYIVKGGKEAAKPELAMKEIKNIFGGHYVELDMKAKSLPIWVEHAISGFGEFMEKARQLEKRNVVSVIVSENITVTNALFDDIAAMIDKACEYNDTLKSSKKIIEVNKKGEIIVYYVSKGIAGGLRLNNILNNGRTEPVIIDKEKRSALYARGLTDQAAQYAPAQEQNSVQITVNKLASSTTFSDSSPVNPNGMPGKNN